MKIILSRKGFDSAVGGVASPILPDGAMLSLPIPLPSAPIGYEDIAWAGASIAPMVEALTRGRVRGGHRAHLDPDLSAASLPRTHGWRPAFGQLGAAQTHLAAQGVGVGDLFLFFGWFRRTDAAASRFLAEAPDEHVLFGWLQIGEVLPVGPRHQEYRERYPWLARHPHLGAHAVPSNTIYVAADRLTVQGRDLGVPGGGTFSRYHPGLRLTAPDSPTRSSWRLPGWLHPARGTALSYHGDALRWRDEGATCRLDSVKQGQEFVARVPEQALAEWLATLLAGCHSRGAPGCREGVRVDGAARRG